MSKNLFLHVAAASVGCTAVAHKLGSLFRRPPVTVPEPKRGPFLNERDKRESRQVHAAHPRFHRAIVRGERLNVRRFTAAQCGCAVLQHERQAPK
jgi:hypothetical protein